MADMKKKENLKGMFVTWVVLTAIGVAIGVWGPARLMPRSMSDNMHLTILTMIVFTVAAAPVAAGVYAVALHALRHWVHKGDNVPAPAAEQTRENATLTASWLIASTLLTVFLLIWGLGALAVDNGAVGRNPLVVDVTGQQWLWTFSYPGSNVQSPTLVLPEGRTVDFHVTALDVTHGFWIANMGVQVDANVGTTTQIHTTPTALGQFDIRCTQFCGLNHAFMVATGNVVTKAQFNSWLASQSQKA
jgi:cytochrome c oxidase subunit 2